MAAAPFDEKEYMQDLGVKSLWGEKGFSTNERTGIRPTLELNGIWGGFQGEGSKTVLPSKASAKISARLVPNQRSEKITQMLLDYFKKIAPPGVTVNAFELHGGEPYMTPLGFTGVYRCRKSHRSQLRKETGAPAGRRKYSDLFVAGKRTWYQNCIYGFRTG